MWKIDGVPYVIEMLKTLDVDTLIDKSESDKLDKSDIWS